MTVVSAQQIVGEYARAWTGGDVDKAMSYLAEDIVCEAPAGKIEGLPAYREFLAGFLEIMTAGTVTNVLGDETSAAVVYITDTKLVQDSRAMDYATVENGKIAHIITVFDRLPFAQARRSE